MVIKARSNRCEIFIFLEHEGLVTCNEMRAIRAEVIVEPFETKAKLGSRNAGQRDTADIDAVSRGTWRSVKENSECGFERAHNEIVTSVHPRGRAGEAPDIERIPIANLELKRRIFVEAEC